MPERNWKEEHDRLDHQLARIEELTHAFSLIMQQIGEQPDRPLTRMEYSALYAIRNGMEDVLK